MEFKDKVVMITGGASGIGAASAEAFAAAGARVLIADSNTQAGVELASRLPEACHVDCDVTMETAVAAAVEVALARWGHLDCAVNSAGTVGQFASLDTLGLDEWRRVIDINLTGLYLCLKYQLAAMKPRGSGAIVNISSGAGLIATPGLGAYCASKHGVLGLTKTAAMEFVKAGIRVNAVLPGATRTPMLETSMQADPALERMIVDSIPSGRMGEPAEIAEAILWLCSARASYVNGHSMLVDGGSVCR